MLERVRRWRVCQRDAFVRDLKRGEGGLVKGGTRSQEILGQVSGVGVALDDQHPRLRIAIGRGTFGGRMAPAELVREQPARGGCAEPSSMRALR